MAQKYEQVYDGEWFMPVKKNYKNACCDCGMVHKINHKIKDGNLWLQFSVDRRATSAMRRAFKFTKDEE